MSNFDWSRIKEVTKYIFSDTLFLLLFGAFLVVNFSMPKENYFLIDQMLLAVLVMLAFFMGSRVGRMEMMEIVERSYNNTDDN